MNAEMDISKNQWRSTGGKSAVFLAIEFSGNCSNKIENIILR